MTCGLVKTHSASVSLRCGEPAPSQFQPWSESNKIPTRTRCRYPGALAALQESGEEATPYLRRHNGGDWGELDGQDRRENQASLQHGFRLLSSYTLRSGTKIWIITEADRSSTTILLPEEY